LLADAPFTFFSIARTLLGQLPLFSNFLVGNSTAIRAVHSVAQTEMFQTQIYVTRGVSGIEGHVATALGMCQGNERPTVVLLGDIALLHDLNSLFALKQSQSPIAVVVVNNRGGGIFKKLPIRAFPELSPYLTTPHQFSFEKVAAAAELAYACCDDEAKLAEALETFKTDRKPIVIECAMDDEIDNTVQQTLHRITLT
jgi:2-succinyl-5-enolpyruvyl-6-hydroxy-3-cyclohexene-1-carboxylate synthase